MKKQRFNQDWTFRIGGGSALEGLAAGNEDKGRKVTLPHDASVEMERNPEEPNGSGNGFFRESNYNYTKVFALDEADEGKNVWLEFEGVYQNAFVYINGAYAGKCPYGYSNFYIDATKYVHFGKENSVKVIVKNGVPSGRWYTGGGIYRDVSIMIADRIHYQPDSVQLAAQDVEDDLAVIRVNSSVQYTGTGMKKVELEVRLLDAEGNTAACDTMPVTIGEHSENVYQQKLYVGNPRLWDEEHPYLYQYYAVIKEGDTVLDEETGTFGIRSLQLDRAHGLRVNGKTVKLRGGCIHHDNGITGTAEFAHAAEFRVKKLKEAGYNAIRSSHYPMSRRLLEACDKYGIYVMDEYADVWTTTKVDFDYGMHMSEWWEHDVTNLVKKDYNHPCVIMYSIGNEIPEIADPIDTQWGKLLADKIRKLDDSRYVTNSMNLLLGIIDRIPEILSQMQPKDEETRDSSDADVQESDEHMAGPAENPEINSMMADFGKMASLIVGSELAGEVMEEAASQVDIVGYNYAACRYEKDGADYPNRIIVGSETYPQDLDKNWELVEKYPYLLGDFSWTAWDYLGEAGIGKITYGSDGNEGFSFYSPYPYKAAYCADMNLLGDRRPISYWREIIWGFRKAPYLSVQLPQYHDTEHHMTEWAYTNAVRSWNWQGYEGKPVTVEVYADGDEAELIVNGKAAGRKPIGEEKKAVVKFETTYEPGSIEVIVYKDGAEAGRDQILTAGEAVQIAAAVDTAELPADAGDIAYVEICMEDASGNLNPSSDKAVSIHIDGPGVILGFGSADPVSEENYFDTTAKAYEGRLKAAVRGTGERGTITVTLTAQGCEDRKVTLEAI